MGNDVPELGDSQNVNVTLFQNRDFHLVPKHENVRSFYPRIGNRKRYEIADSGINQNFWKSRLRFSVSDL